MLDGGGAWWWRMVMRGWVMVCGRLPMVPRGSGWWQWVVVEVGGGWVASGTWWVSGGERWCAFIVCLLLFARHFAVLLFFSL